MVVFVAVCFAVVSVCVALQVPDNRQPCSLCGPPVDVTLTAKTEVGILFNFSVTLYGTPQRELVSLLQEAAEHDGRFNFTVTYMKRLGFYLESINNKREDYARNKTWWHIYSEEGPTTAGGAHCEGISTYVPEHKESVMFLLTNRTIDHPACPTECSHG